MWLDDGAVQLNICVIIYGLVSCVQENSCETVCLNGWLYVGIPFADIKANEANWLSDI